MAITFTHYRYNNRHIYYVNLSGSHFLANVTVTVTVTATPSVARNWLYWHTPDWNHFVGLGVQWTPRDRADPPADTVQLCIGTQCLIFQLSRAERVPSLLRRILENPGMVFVGFRNNSDRWMLRASAHELKMFQNPLDIRHLVGADLANSPLEMIVERCLGFRGVRLRREVSMSNWRAETLCDHQVLQASLEAYCAFHIGIRYFAFNT